MIGSHYSSYKFQFIITYCVAPPHARTPLKSSAKSSVAQPLVWEFLFILSILGQGGKLKQVKVQMGEFLFFFAKAVIGCEMKIPHKEIKMCSLIEYKLY